MTVIITASLIAALFAFFSKYEKRIDWFKFAFIVVIFIACIHYNYGNDYKGYYWNWNYISGTSLKTLLTTSRFNFFNYDKPELGWIFLNKIFGFNNGFYYMVATINIIEGVIYYKFIKRFVPEKLYFWSFFLYVFTYKYYLLNFSMMRQGFAMALVLFSFLYFCEKHYKRSVISLTLAITMHVAAIIMVPFFLLCKFEEKIKLRAFSLVVLPITLLTFFSSTFSGKLFNFIISMSIFSDYKTFYAGTLSTNSVGLGFAVLTIPYIIMIYFIICRSTGISKEEKYLIILAYVAFLTKPFEFIGAALVTRVGYYFSVFDIAIVPILYSKIKSPILRIMLYASIISITFFTYFGFFTDPTYKEAFSEFHTIFELFK